MPDRTARRLKQLLAKEHDAITSGDFDSLQLLSAEKEQMLIALQKEDLPKSTARGLAEATMRNQTLLQAAMRGIQDAAQVLGAMKDARQGSVVYGRDGKVARLPNTDKRLSQKL